MQRLNNEEILNVDENMLKRLLIEMMWKNKMRLKRINLVKNMLIRLNYVEIMLKRLNDVENNKYCWK